MKCIVDGAVATSFAMPLRQTLMNVFAIALKRHINNCRDTTPRGCDRAGFKSVNCSSATKWKLHVSVYINAAGNYIFAFGIYNFVGSDTQ